ncbi:hypothetical protein K461DRAFT_307926 [Myriangium duriaei CBS 260.36]|uniref:Uncharacterized protein n=1 Tax=Myriangium duriaei CBS 260.36 TaxID=1168546 RepID=A0A9P4IWP7_9PEZI|nr:hypothetical protein K461DRAFT_307926 [Myriangium duriaei CBS 260.36]
MTASQPGLSRTGNLSGRDQDLLQLVSNIEHLPSETRLKIYDIYVSDLEDQNVIPSRFHVDENNRQSYNEHSEWSRSLRPPYHLFEGSGVVVKPDFYAVVAAPPLLWLSPRIAREVQLNLRRPPFLVHPNHYAYICTGSWELPATDPVSQWLSTGLSEISTLLVKSEHLDMLHVEIQPSKGDFHVALAITMSKVTATISQALVGVKILMSLDMEEHFVSQLTTDIKRCIKARGGYGLTLSEIKLITDAYLNWIGELSASCRESPKLESSFRDIMDFIETNEADTGEEEEDNDDEEDGEDEDDDHEKEGENEDEDDPASPRETLETGHERQRILGRGKTFEEHMMELLIEGERAAERADRADRASWRI